MNLHRCPMLWIIPLAILVLGLTLQRGAQAREKKWKIFHVMSYHSPWKWTDDQFNGFKTALGGLDIEYRVFQMDTKQNPSKEAKAAAGKEARQIIETWKPDLVYANDDNAMLYVVKHYVNSSLPFVFSGVNADPEKYGFHLSQNITGILEQEHFTQTLKLLQQIVPKVQKIAVILDEGPTWEGVKQRMEEKLEQVPSVRITSWDVISRYDDYKKRVAELQHKADAIALLGIFTYTDEKGKTVPYPEVLRWTAENSRLPDFSFWEDRISYGTLCAVTVSGYEQGFAAGQMARQILLKGSSPDQIPMRPSIKGEPVISLARARKLGIRIKAGLLLTADVMTTFKWDE